MSTSMSDVNRELVQITEAHAGGQLDRQAFRRRRRELICQVTGETPPAQSEEEKAAAVSEDDTHPKLAAVTVAQDDAETTRAEPEGPSEAAPQEVPGGNGERVSSWKLTALLMLVAIAGLAGLLWFVLR